MSNRGWRQTHKFLTDPEDVVVDIFSGSNTTGQAAEVLGRRWLSMDLNREYTALSAVRFMDQWSDDEVRRAVARLDAGEVVEIYLGLLFRALPKQC